jgi:hypothetical protein
MRREGCLIIHYQLPPHQNADQQEEEREGKTGKVNSIKIGSAKSKREDGHSSSRGQGQLILTNRLKWPRLLHNKKRGYQ